MSNNLQAYFLISIFIISIISGLDPFQRLYPDLKMTA